MNWDVITKLSSLEIQLHWATATMAFLFGLIIFANRKGTRFHKSIGVAYVVLMLVTAVSAFFIRRVEVTGLEYLTLKGMTFIHLFVPLTLLGLFGGMWGIFIQKDAKAHRKPLVASYIGALIVAGGLTFLPGRRMWWLFFAAPEQVQAWIERALG